MRHSNRDRARQLRRNQTDSEAKLWSILRARQVMGWKFKRQVPIGSFIADFACIELKLIIEADGGQHNERAEQDAKRTAWLENEGWRVLRFWNNDILSNSEGVYDEIAEALRSLDKSNPSP